MGKKGKDNEEKMIKFSILTSINLKFSFQDFYDEKFLNIFELWQPI